jgi:hypothetical protein
VDLGNTLRLIRRLLCFKSIIVYKKVISYVRQSSLYRDYIGYSMEDEEPKETFGSSSSIEYPI